jgi:CheY-like chemotaxis protein
MNQVLESAIELREYDLKVSNIGIETDFERKLPLTMADSHALQQVFVNLIINAEQAIKGAQRGGTIAIKTERENGTIRVSVSDDGPGIPEGELGLIFEPFYTSKPPGQGTGLGLAVSRKIVQGHGGKMWAASKEGKGATFIIELPVVAAGKTEEAPRPAVRETPPAKSRILVVDDELPVQELMCGVLEAEGHEVHLASNGEAALACLGAYEYDLVISDIRMPQLDGEELYAQICSNWPHLADRVILSTGDVVTDKTRAFLEKANLPRITKPFDISRLRQVVRGALGQRAGSTRVPGNASGPKE